MLAFAVTLSRAASRMVPVDVTSHGSAQAGEDYMVKNGTLTFEAASRSASRFGLCQPISDPLGSTRTTGN